MILNTFEHDELRIELRDDQDKVIMEWTGASDWPEPSSILFPFLERVADETVGKTLTVDLRGLQFMNSASVSPMLKFIRQLERLQVDATLLYDGQAHWQRVHYNCMKAVVTSLEHVRVELA